ncbi:MAG TPA: BCD family MFS transporter [Anaerolineales bacterium]|nr:BCD family MFS transporter [Anaerolineales bacterium]
MKKAGMIFNRIRLALFPIGYGMIGALVGGTLNRVFIADIGLAASLVGLVLSIQYLVSPIRVWLGYRSDGFPIFGKRREWYMILGALVFGGGLVMAAYTAVSENASRGLMIAGMIVAFTIYGLGRNLAHNSYQALLTDVFSASARQRAITLYEVATLVGSVAGAGALGSALKVYEPSKLISVTIGAAVVAFVFAFLGAIRQEPEVVEESAEKARAQSFGQTLKEIVLPDPQVKLFFGIVILTFIGTLAQDDFLEPYGALVLNMDVGETTQLTAFWGIGVLISMLASGLFLIKRLGFLRLMRIGIVASVLVFVGVISVGLAGNPGAFRILVLVMGLATGLAGAGMLSGVISFTTSLRAGLLMGVWGMANLLGKAAGGLMGGVVFDLMRLAFCNAFLAYATLFGIEVVVLVVAFVLTARLDIQSSKASMEVTQVPA